MRLEKSIQNNTNIMTDVLKSDCDKFLKEIKGGELLGKKDFMKRGWILRGIDDRNVKNGLIKKQSYISSGRKPRAASWLQHSLTNLVGRQLFGWPIRDGVATRGIGGSHVGEERVFGKMRIFLPIGDYEYVWSPNIRDFNDKSITEICSSIKSAELKKAIYIITRFYQGEETDAAENLEEEGIKYTYQEVYTEAWKHVRKFIKDNYKDDKIRGAIEMGNEVSFKCNEYYLVDDNFTFGQALEHGGWK